MRHCCARCSVLSSFLMVLFEIFDPYGEQFLETSTEKNGFTTAKEATLNQTNANKFYLYLLAVFFSKCSISAIYFCSLGREGLQFRQRKLNRTFIQ